MTVIAHVIHDGLHSVPSVKGPRMGCIKIYQQAYYAGELPPNYPVPARIITFDYWPAHETMDGKPALYCFDQYHPDKQREWLKIGDNNF